jgi:hypothetical protein
MVIAIAVTVVLIASAVIYAGLMIPSNGKDGQTPGTYYWVVPSTFSRTHPAPMNTSITLHVNNFTLTNGKIIRMTVIQVIRGQAALDKLSNNKFPYADPGTGKEFLLVHIRLEYLYCSSPDDYLLYPYTGIDVLQSSSVTAENDYYYTVAPVFPTLEKIYPGGIADGFLTWRIDQGDPSPILSYDFNPYSSEDPVLWFALY